MKELEMQGKLREVRETPDEKSGFHGAKEIPLMPSTMKKEHDDWDEWGYNPIIA